MIYEIARVTLAVTRMRGNWHRTMTPLRLSSYTGGKHFPGPRDP